MVGRLVNWCQVGRGAGVLEGGLQWVQGDSSTD